MLLFVFIFVIILVLGRGDVLTHSKETANAALSLMLIRKLNVSWKKCCCNWPGVLPNPSFFVKISQFSEDIHSQCGSNVLVILVLKGFPDFLFFSIRHALVWWCPSCFSGQKNSEATSLCKFSMKSQSQMLGGWMCRSVKNLWQESVCVYSCFLLVTCENLFLAGGWCSKGNY